jgi:hypothetical protein
MGTNFKERRRLASKVLPLGDFEIRQIIFEHPHVKMVLLDPSGDSGDSSVELLLVNVGFFKFTSDLIQNVIGGVYLYEFNGETKTAILSLFQHRASAEIAEISIDTCLLVFFEPVAGGELYVLCDAVEMNGVIALCKSNLRNRK